MSRRRCVFLLLATALAACGAASGGGAERILPRELDQFFIGTQVIRLPDGSERDGGTVVSHRTLQPAQDRIVERTDIGAADGTVEHHEVHLAVSSDNSFVLTEPGTTLAGEGVLEGEPWNWTAWHVETRLPDGTRAEVDHLLGHELRTESHVSLPDGTPSVVIRQVLELITRERYEEARRAMGRGAAP